MHFKCINDNPNISYTELTTLLNIKRRAVAKRINQLKELGMIERIGSDKAGHWVITEKGKTALHIQPLDT